MAEIIRIGKKEPWVLTCHCGCDLVRVRIYVRTQSATVECSACGDKWSWDDEEKGDA
jgi:hypothetical protein